MKRTPGKWKVKKTRDFYLAVESNGDVVAHIFDRTKPGQDAEKPTAETHANAKIIAAAPDLLKCAEALIDYLEHEDEAWAKIELKKTRLMVARARGEK